MRALPSLGPVIIPLHLTLSPTLWKSHHQGVTVAVKKFEAHRDSIKLKAELENEVGVRACGSGWGLWIWVGQGHGAGLAHAAQHRCRDGSAATQVNQ